MSVTGVSKNVPGRGPRVQRSTVLTVFLFLITWVMMLSMYRRRPVSELAAQVAAQVSAQVSSLKSKPVPVSAPVVLAPNPNSLVGRRGMVNLKQIWMDEIEIDVVLRYLKNVNNYLEWGSGGSTTNFAKFANRRAVSIEHNKEWCELMPTRIQKAAIRPVELRCVPNDLPYAAEGNYKQFKSYIDEIAKLGEPVWDFVLVDGRCRVGAAIKALSYISSESTLVLHDSERIVRDGALYKPILDYYDVVERVSGSSRRGIAILRRKPSLANLQGNHARVQEILEDVLSKASYR